MTQEAENHAAADAALDAMKRCLRLRVAGWGRITARERRELKAAAAQHQADAIAFASR